MTFAKTTKSPALASMNTATVAPVPTQQTLPTSRVAVNLEGLDYEIIDNKLVIKTMVSSTLPSNYESCEHMRKLGLRDDQIDRVMDSFYIAVNKELIINLLSDRVV